MKRKLLFFDTETTGNTPDDFLCQIAYKEGEKSACELFKPPKEIPVEAMVVHHITNKMVAEKPTFQYSEIHKDLHEKAHDNVTVFIAHNYSFDQGMLKKEGIMPELSICTLRVARALDEEGVIPSYKLQYLRYFLDIEIEATAHDALGDVLVLEKLFERLLKKICEKNSVDEDAGVEFMLDISSKPSIIKKINFGKHNGKTVEEVSKIAPDYLAWLYQEKKKSPQGEEDWLYTLEKYVK